MSKTYEIKHLWTNVYLCEKFFARIRMMSQCEATVSIMKVIKNRSTISEFIQDFDWVVCEYRNNKSKANFDSSSGKPILTTSLESFEG